MGWSSWGHLDLAALGSQAGELTVSLSTHCAPILSRCSCHATLHLGQVLRFSSWSLNSV